MSQEYKKCANSNCGHIIYNYQLKYNGNSDYCDKFCMIESSSLKRAETVAKNAKVFEFEDNRIGKTIFPHKTLPIQIVI